MNYFTDTMQPIIELAYSKMRMEQENEVMKAVQSIGVNVDKERLIQALTDAYRFWQEGYQVGVMQPPEWISVEERLPEPFVSVLVYMPEERPLPTVHEGFLAREGMWYANHFDREPMEITHWMPLPKPPKEEV
jgi:hypothetical protein